MCSKVRIELLIILILSLLELKDAVFVSSAFYLLRLQDFVPLIAHHD